MSIEETWCGGVDCANGPGDVMPMHVAAFSVDEGYSEEFEVKVGVHQGSGTQPNALHHCA